MKYGDFSSLVQLGVGLHVGTALLQIYGEIGLQPLVRTLARINSLFKAPKAERPPKEIKEELEGLEHRYEVFKIRLFQEYRKYVIANSAVAMVLAAILAAISFVYDWTISGAMEWCAIVLVFLSLFPAPITLAVLWSDADTQMKPLKKEADELEKRALRVSQNA